LKYLERLISINAHNIKQEWIDKLLSSLVFSTKYLSEKSEGHDGISLGPVIDFYTCIISSGFSLHPNIFSDLLARDFFSFTLFDYSDFLLFLISRKVDMEDVPFLSLVFSSVVTKRDKVLLSYLKVFGSKFSSKAERWIAENEVARVEMPRLLLSLQ